MITQRMGGYKRKKEKRKNGEPSHWKSGRMGKRHPVLTNLEGKGELSAVPGGNLHKMGKKERISLDKREKFDYSIK